MSVSDRVCKSGCRTHSLKDVNNVEKRIKATVHFDQHWLLMHMNGGSPAGASARDRDKDNGTTISQEEAKRLRNENNRLKRTLNRRLSSRSASSARIDLAALQDHGSFDDDSYALLKDNTTLHGLRDCLVAPDWPLRIMFSLIVAFAIGLTVHGVWQVYQEYKTNRVVVSYLVKEDSMLALPDIVICPLNRFNRSYLDHLNVTEGLAQYLEMSYTFWPLYKFQEEVYNRTLIDLDAYQSDLELLLDKLGGNMSYAQFLDKASIGCHTFMKNDPQRCENVVEIMTSAGKCFRFTGADQSDAGYGNGDTFKINLPIHLYNPGSNQLLNDGIVLKLSARNKGTDNDFSFIPAGVHAVVSLTATKYEFMNDSPNYECEEDPYQNYSRVYCMESCRVKEAENVCNCSLAAATQKRKPEICTTAAFYHCFFKEMLKRPNAIEDCKKECKNPCTYWQYQKSISYSHFPGKMVSHFIDNTSQEYEDLKNTITLELFFTDLTYIVIKHVVAMPISNLIAQIGGQFSLWAGGSVISLCQLLIYFVRLCYKNKRVRRLHLNCCSTAGVTSKKANHQHTPSATEISSTPDDFILTSTTVDGSQHAEPKHL